MDEMTDAASNAGCAGAVEPYVEEIHVDIITAFNMPLQPKLKEKL